MGGGRKKTGAKLRLLQLVLCVALAVEQERQHAYVPTKWSSDRAYAMTTIRSRHRGRERR